MYAVANAIVGLTMYLTFNSQMGRDLYTIHKCYSFFNPHVDKYMSQQDTVKLIVQCMVALAYLLELGVPPPPPHTHTHIKDHIINITRPVVQ